MFILSPKPLEVFWPVTLSVPMDGGEVKKFQIELKYKILDTDEFKEKYPAFENSSVEELANFEDRMRAFWADMVTDWKEVGDEKGKPIKFTKAKFAAFLKKPYVATAVTNGYHDCVNGRKAKN